MEGWGWDGHGLTPSFFLPLSQIAVKGHWKGWYRG